MVRKTGKGEVFKKWLSAIIALIFLFNSCSPAWAREGNFGHKKAWRYFANGMISEFQLAYGCFRSPFKAGFASIAGDLAGLTLYYTSYKTYSEPIIIAGFNTGVTKSQAWSMAASIGASAAGGCLDGALFGSKGVEDPDSKDPSAGSDTDPGTGTGTPDPAQSSSTIPEPTSSSIPPPQSGFVEWFNSAPDKNPGLFKDPEGWLKYSLAGPVADPYYNYGKDSNWYAATFHLTGDLAIGFGKLMVHNFIKDSLVDGSIKIKDKKLIEFKEMDETEAEIIAGAGTYAFALVFTPFVRRKLGDIAYGKGNYTYDNQTGYLSKKNDAYVAPDVTYGIDTNNDGDTDCETETFSSPEIAVMLQNGKIKPDTKIMRYDKDGLNTEMTGEELKPIFQDPYVVLTIGSQMQTVTVKDTEGNEHSVSLPEFSAAMVLNDKTVQELGEREGITYSLKDINNNTITISGGELNDRRPDIDRQLKIIGEYSPMYKSVLATTGGFLNDAHGNPIEPKLGAGLKTLQAAGLSPFVGAAVKVGTLQLLKYYTHYGTEDGRVYENTLKMAAAEAAGNIAEAAVRNSNRLSARYAGTVVRDSSGEKIYVNPYAQRGHTGSLGKEYRRLVGKEIVMQAGLFLSEWAWAAYCKKKGIQPDAVDELMHLAASSLVRGLMDTLRADPGKAEKKRAFFIQVVGENDARVINENELIPKDSGKFAIKVDGKEKEVTIKEFADKDKDAVFIDEKGNVYVNPDASDIANKSLINVSLDKKNTQAGAPVSYDISIDASSGLSDHFMGGKMFISGYRNTQTGAWISNAQYEQLPAEDKDVSKYKKQTAVTATGRFSRAVIEDFNNRFTQAATRSALYTSPQFTPGTGLGAFMAHQQNQEMWAQHILAVGQGVSPAMVAANRVAGNMRYLANANPAESLSALVTNPFIKDPRQRSYATVITTNERLKFIKNNLEQQQKQYERAIAAITALLDEYSKQGGIEKLDEELKSLKEENLDSQIAVSEKRVEQLQAVLDERSPDDTRMFILTYTRGELTKEEAKLTKLREAKGTLNKLEAAVEARDFIIPQQLYALGLATDNKIYISRQQAGEELKSLKQEIEVLEWKRDDLRANEDFASKISSRRTVNEMADIMNQIDAKKEKMAKLEAAVEAYNKLYALGLATYNKIYISRQEAYEDILSLLPKVKAGLQAKVKSSKTQIEMINQSAEVIGILGALPFIGAYPQVVFLSNVAVVTKGDSAFNDWIIGGIVDYNVDRAFETNAPMSEYLKKAVLEPYIIAEAQNLRLSEDEKDAFLEAMAKADQKAQMLSSTYYFSVAGVYQGSETYANVPLLTAGNITPELSLRLEQASSEADTPLIVESEIIKEALTPEKITARLADIENGLLTAKDKTKTALEKEKVDLINIQTIQESWNKNPEFINALTSVPGDGEELKEKKKKATDELTSGRILYSDYGLTERTTVDEFGRAVETQHFAPQFIDGKWQTAHQDIVTKHYYGPFGHAVSKTTDYTQIRLPDAEAWPVLATDKKFDVALDEIWDKLKGEFKPAGIEGADVLRGLGVIGADDKQQYKPEELRDKFVAFVEKELQGNPDEAINTINSKLASLVKDAPARETSFDFKGYLPPVEPVSYKIRENGERVIDKVRVLNTAEFKQLQEAYAAALEGKPLGSGIEAVGFSNAQARENINRLKANSELVEEVTRIYYSEIWHKPLKKLDFDTAWGAIVAHLVLNPDVEGRTWDKLMPDQKKRVLEGATAWRLITYGLYNRDGVKQTIPDNNNTLYFYPGSDADQMDFNKVKTIYLPVIPGQKAAAPAIGPISVAGPEYQLVSTGPNTHYDISLYSTQGGNSAYAGPTGRATLSDINSGPLLKPYTQYSVPSVGRQLEKLIHDYAETNFEIGSDAYKKLVKFLTDELGRDGEEALSLVEGLTEENYTFDRTLELVASFVKTNVSIERAKVKRDEIAKSLPQFKQPAAETQFEPKSKFLEKRNLASWAIRRLAGQKEIVDAVANKQSELEADLSRDLYNVRQFQFYKNENIGNREISLPTWGASTGYGLIQSEAGQPGNLGDNRFLQQLRFNKYSIYTYDGTIIDSLRDKKQKEAQSAGNNELSTMLKGITIYPVAKEISLVNEPNNKDILGATYERTTEVFAQGDKEGYVSDRIGSDNIISRSKLDEGAIKKELKAESKREQVIEHTLSTTKDH